MMIAPLLVNACLLSKIETCFVIQDCCLFKHANKKNINNKLIALFIRGEKTTY